MMDSGFLWAGNTFPPCFILKAIPSRIDCILESRLVEPRWLLEYNFMQLLLIFLVKNTCCFFLILAKVAACLSAQEWNAVQIGDSELCVSLKL